MPLLLYYIFFVINVWSLVTTNDKNIILYGLVSLHNTHLPNSHVAFRILFVVIKTVRTFYENTAILYVFGKRQLLKKVQIGLKTFSR